MSDLIHGSAGGDGNAGSGSGDGVGNAGTGGATPPGADGNNGAAAGDGAGAAATPPEWLGSLADESLRGHDALKGVPSVDDLAKGYIEGIEANAAMSAPDSPEGYEFDAKDLGEQAEKTMRTVFHQIGMTKAQAAKAVELVKADREAQAKALETAKAKVKEAAVASLTKDWGDKTNANLAAANRALAKFFPPEFMGFMEQTGLGNHEMFIRGLHKIATLISEDSLVTTEGAGAETRERRADGKPMLTFKSM